MAKYKNYDYSQSLLIPVSLEEQLCPAPWSSLFTHWWRDESTCLFLRKDKIEHKIKVLVEDNIEMDKEENTFNQQALANREKQIERLHQQSG